MANTLLLKRTATPGKVPTISDLTLGELCLNTYEGKLYTIKNGGTAKIVQLGGGDVYKTNNNVYSGTNVYTQNVGIGFTDTSIFDPEVFDPDLFDPVLPLPVSQLSFANNYGIDVNTTAVDTTAATTVSSFSTSIFRSATYQVQVTQGSKYLSTSISVLHDGTTVFINEYGTVYNHSLIASFDASISAGQLRLQVIMKSSAVAIVKVVSNKIAV